MSRWVIYASVDGVIEGIWDRDVSDAAGWDEVEPIAVVEDSSATLERCPHTGWHALHAAGRGWAAVEVLDSPPPGVRVTRLAEDGRG